MASRHKILQLSMMNCFTRNYSLCRLMLRPTNQQPISSFFSHMPLEIKPNTIASSVVTNAKMFHVASSANLLSPHFRQYSTDDKSETENVGQEKPSWDRSKINPLEVDVDTSIAYMKSEAYKTTYGKKKVWEIYRANHKHSYHPEPRKMCYRGGKLATGNPCPICRDNYLLIHYKNIELIRQFMTSDGIWMLKGPRTHICKKQQRRLQISILKAVDTGLLENKLLPSREYDYKQYYPETAFVDSQSDLP